MAWMAICLIGQSSDEGIKTEIVVKGKSRKESRHVEKEQEKWSFKDFCIVKSAGFVPLQGLNR
jgi:hypothetical protein